MEIEMKEVVLVRKDSISPFIKDLIITIIMRGMIGETTEIIVIEGTTEITETEETEITGMINLFDQTKIIMVQNIDLYIPIKTTLNTWGWDYGWGWGWGFGLGCGVGQI